MKVLAGALMVCFGGGFGCNSFVRPVPDAPRSEALFDWGWRWTDEQGADVVFSKWRGTRIIVTGIYTTCTSRCPLTVDKLQALDAEMGRLGLQGQFLLVTLDPATDDVPRIRRFKQSHHLPSSWHVLRGSREETLAFARLLGMRAMYDDGHIDHDVRIAVFDAGGHLTRSFSGWGFDEREAAKAM